MARPRNDATQMTPARERIMIAASRLFAQRGLHGTGVREISREANTNVNLVAYHFQTKEALFLAIVNERADRLDELRKAMLDDLEAQYSPNIPSPEEIVRALVHPIFVLLEEGAEAWLNFVRMLYREAGTPLWREVHAAHLGPTLRRFTAALHRTLPRARRADIVFVLELAIHTLGMAARADASADIDESVGGERSPQEFEERMIKAITGAASAFS